MVDEVRLLLNSWNSMVMRANYNTWSHINGLADILSIEISHHLSNLTLYIQNRKRLNCSFIFSDQNMMNCLFYDRNSNEPLEHKLSCVRVLLCLAYATKNIFTECMYSQVVPSLIQWTKESPEPLQTYATGLLEFCIRNRIDFHRFISKTEKIILLNSLMDRLVSNHSHSRYGYDITWQLTPINEVTKQIYKFRMLTSLARSNHLFPIFLDCNEFMCMLRDCLGGLQGRPIIPLMVEARQFLAVLLTHESFALMFVDADDWIQLLTTNLCQSVMLPTSICMMNLASNEAAMEHLFQTRPQVANDLTMFVLNLFDNIDRSVRCNAMVFFDFAFRYKAMLELFDANDGSQKIQKLFEDIQVANWRDMFMPFLAFEKYVKAHLLLKYRELCVRSFPVVRLMATDKEVQEMIDALLKCFPFCWKTMEHIAARFLKLVLFTLTSFGHAVNTKRLLDILNVFSLTSTVQLAICEKVDFRSTRSSVLERLLYWMNSGFIEDIQSRSDVGLSAIRIIANCVSVPIIKNGDNSVFENSRKKIRSTNGLMLMSELLKPQLKCSNDVKNLACKVLCVLADDDIVKDIICKTTIYKNKYLQNFANAELDTNVESNAHAKELLKIVEPMEEPMLSNVNNLQPSNVLIRLDRREKGLGNLGSELDKRLKYLKFRSFPSDCWLTIDSQAMEVNSAITYLKYSFDQKNLIVCNEYGSVKIINISNGTVTNHCETRDACNYIEFEKSGALMLTSFQGLSSLRLNMNFVSSLWNIRYDCAQYANCNPSRILASKSKFGAIVDTETCMEVTRFIPLFKNNYRIYKAVFSPDDRMILYDGVMLDGKTGETIFKFDKLNSVQNGFFHPYRQEVIINSEIWDLRTRKLIKLVPALDSKNVIFGTVDNILFTVPHGTHKTCMEMIDAGTYNTVSSHHVIKCDGKFDVDKRNTSIAVAECQLSSMETIVKLYHINGTPLNKDIY